MVGRYDIINSDLFDVAARLKNIDEGYFVVYNYRLKRFEVHHKGQRGGSLAFVVPHNRLDGRTVTYALKTRRENMHTLIIKMEEENQDRLKKQKKLIEERAAAAAEKALRQF